MNVFFFFFFESAFSLFTNEKHVALTFNIINLTQFYAKFDFWLKFSDVNAKVHF